MREVAEEGNLAEIPWSKLPGEAWKCKEAPEQRLPVQPGVGLADFTAWVAAGLPGNGRQSVCRESFAEVSAFPLCFGEFVFPELWALRLCRWGCSPNTDRCRTLTSLGSLIAGWPKSETAHLCRLVTLISAPCCRVYQGRIIQSSLLVLRGEKLWAYL